MRRAKLGLDSFEDDVKRIATAIASVTGAAGPHNILSATHSDAATVAVSRGALIYGDDTPEWELLPVGAAGQLLHTDGVDVAWYTLLATDLPAHNLLSAQHGDTLTAAVSRGSLVYGNITPAWAELVHPAAAGYALTTDANDVLWDQTPTWTGLHTFDGGWLLGAGQTGDLNGVADALVIDADGDTTISAPVDDRIDFEIGGADDFTMTANSLNVLSGSTITMADDTWIGLGAAAGRLIFDSTPATDQIQLATADLYFNTGLGIIHADGVTAGMVLRANGTRYVPAAASTTLPFAPTARGDMIAADATPAWARLAFIGAANRILTTTATDPAWSGYSIIGTAGQTYTFGTTGGTIPTAAGTLTVATANAITAAGVITHAITSSSNPGAAAAILATGAAGELALTGILSLAEYMDHIGDTDTYLRFQADNITLRAGGIDMVNIVEGAIDYVNFPAGLVFINEVANTGMTQGITINQGANDDEALSIKSSDVAHGMTDFAETDTYCVLSKHDALAGGIRISGLRDANGTPDGAVTLWGYLGENVTTSKTSATGWGIINIVGQVKSGTGATAPNADGNVLSIGTDATTIRFIFAEDGSAYADVAWTTFDEYDDISLLASLESEFARHREDDIRDNFGQFLDDNRHLLQQLGIVNFYDDGPRAMVNFTKLTMLLTGAIQQLEQRITQYQEKLYRLDKLLGVQDGQ